MKRNSWPVAVRLSAGSLCLRHGLGRSGVERAVGAVLGGRYLAQAVLIRTGHGDSLPWRLGIETVHAASMGWAVATFPAGRSTALRALGLAGVVIAADLAYSLRGSGR